MKPSVTLRSASLLLAAILLSACSAVTPTMNQPLSEAGRVLPKQAGAEQAKDAVNSKSLSLILTFSGGGTRAAAFSYGVMKGLRDTNYLRDGQSRSLLQEVDLISSVSGGSFTAAYYGLYGDDLFVNYERDFLRKPVQTHLLNDWLARPSNWFKLFPALYNRSDLAAEYYEQNIFQNKQFKDFRSDGPAIVINATDVSAGVPFSFTPENFEWICSNLSNYPVGRAVAASAAVPVLFSPITLRNYADCEITKPDVVNAGVSRNALQALDVRKYKNKKRYPFLHLLDGGIADNLGVRSVLHAVSEHGDNFWTLMQHYGIQDTEDVAFIIVNAADDISPAIAQMQEEPPTDLVLAAVTTIQSSRYNTDTLDMLDYLFSIWEKQVITGRCGTQQVKTCKTTRFHLVELNFKQLPQQLSNQLSLTETSLELPSEKVDQLIQAGEYVLKRSKPFSDLLRELSRPQ